MRKQGYILYVFANAFGIFAAFPSPIIEAASGRLHNSGPAACSGLQRPSAVLWNPLWRMERRQICQKHRQIHKMYCCLRILPIWDQLLRFKRNSDNKTGCTNTIQMCITNISTETKEGGFVPSISVTLFLRILTSYVLRIAYHIKCLTCVNSFEVAISQTFPNVSIVILF